MEYEVIFDNRVLLEKYNHNVVSYSRCDGIDASNLPDGKGGVMKFFKPEDFKGSALGLHPGLAADQANAKLEREGKVVTGYLNCIGNMLWGNTNPYDTHKALLINIEPIEVCKHPVEKVKERRLHPASQSRETYFECACGMKVRPSAYEVVDE